MTTVLPMDEDQWRKPVILGSAANLFSSTAERGAASEPSFDGFTRLSEIAGTTAGDRTSAGGAGGVVTDCGEVGVLIGDQAGECAAIGGFQVVIEEFFADNGAGINNVDEEIVVVLAVGVGEVRPNLAALADKPPGDWLV